MTFLLNFRTADIFIWERVFRHTESQRVFLFLLFFLAQAVSAIRERATALPRTAMQLRAFPMYAGLPSEDQVKVFDSEPDPTFVRRVVVARDPPLSI